MKNLDSTLQITLTAIGLSLAFVSACLTATFLYSLGRGNDYGISFAAAGVLLDMAKTVFPVGCVILLANKKRFLAMVGFVLSGAMMLTSYNMSVAAVSQSFYEIRTEQASDSLKQSSKYQNITQAINQLESKLEALRAQQQGYLKISYKSQARAMQPEITATVNEIANLYLERGSMPPAVEAAAEFDHLAVSILAGLIEVVATTALILATSLDSKPKSPVKQYAQAPQVEEVVAVTEEATDAPLADTTEMAEANEPDELFVAAKNVLLEGVRPSERALQDALGITRKRAGELLIDLEASNIIWRDARGHRQLSNV